MTVDDGPAPPAGRGKLRDALVSIVLPVHNQGDHIAGIVREYEATLDQLPNRYELVLVLNACTDSSRQVCSRLAQESHTIRMLELDQGGWGVAVKAGITAAEGDIICYTNSARTSPRELSLCLLYALINPGTVIKANRKIRENWKRRLGSLLYNLECRALFDLPHWDINGTPKVFPRECSRLLELNREDDLIDAEFNAVCRYEEYPMLEVPIFSSRRHGGKSTTNYGSALRMYVGAYQLWRTRRGSGASEAAPMKRRSTLPS